MKFSLLYGMGAKMGWTPAQVGECGLWEFMAAAEGSGHWKIEDAGEPMTADRLAQLGIDGFT